MSQWIKNTICPGYLSSIPETNINVVGENKLLKLVFWPQLIYCDKPHNATYTIINKKFKNWWNVLNVAFDACMFYVLYFVIILHVVNSIMLTSGDTFVFSHVDHFFVMKIFIFG